MSTKRCQLINQSFVGEIGTVLTVYGHKFIIQENGSAIGDIDEAFTEAEEKLGRFKILEDDPTKVHPVARKDLLTDFGYEIKDLFGTNDINKLYKRIKRFDKSQAILFAETRLNLKFPDTMSHSKMVNEISNAIKLQSTPPTIKKTTLDDLSDLEKKLNKSKGK